MRIDTLNIADYFLTDRCREGRGGSAAVRHGGRTRTYRDIDRLSTRYANALIALGVRPEERVLIGLPDGPDYVGALFGVLKAGAVVVMVNQTMAAANLRAVIGYSRARVAVVHSASMSAFAGPADDPTELQLLVVDRPAVQVGRAVDFTAIESDYALEAVTTHPDDPAMWLFSGGTTGTPRAVVQTHASFVNTAEKYGQQTLGLREDDITLSVPKLYFGYATGSNLLFPSRLCLSLMRRVQDERDVLGVDVATKSSMWWWMCWSRAGTSTPAFVTCRRPAGSRSARCSQ